MQRYLSKSKLRSKVDETVKKLQKIYEPKNTSARHLFSVMNIKTATSELVYKNKYCQNKKVIVPGAKSPIIFESDSPTKLRKIMPRSLPKQLSEKRLTPSPSRFLFTTELNLNSKKINRSSNSRIDKLIRMSDSPIMHSYKNLMKTCSQATPVKESAFENEEKLVKKLSKKINYIIEDFNDDDG